MHRRDVLAGLSTAGLASLAGCSAVADLVDPSRGPASARTRTRTRTPTLTPSGPAVDGESVTVSNATARERYVTVVVAERYDGRRREREAFVRSVRLVPGQRRVFGDGVGHAGRYRVLVETADGLRTERPWRVAAGGDGLEVTVVGSGAGAGAGAGSDAGSTPAAARDARLAVWPNVRCGPDCRLATRVATDADLPLRGDGSGYWYSPANVVVRNHGRARRVTLTVTAGAGPSPRDLLSATYDLPAGVQARVPVTFRTGQYGVRVGTDDGLAGASRWYVPHEPARVVTLGRDDGADRPDSGSAGEATADGRRALAFGCGPAVPRLRVANGSEARRRVAVAVYRPDGGRAHDAGYDLDPGAERVVAPVDTGRYVVEVTVDGGPSTRGVWWACPLHASTDVVVGVDGTATVDQSFREYVADPSGYDWAAGLGSANGSGSADGGGRSA